MNLKKTKKGLSLILLLFVFVATSFTTQAQNVVRGIVLDETNLPLPGATIVIKGTDTGTSTDLAGRFELTVSENDRILLVSFVGFLQQEVVIGDGNLTITLQEMSQALGEVVVVGYGTQFKSDLVSAVAKTDLEKALVVPTSDINEMLRGRITGLQVEVGGGTLRPGGQSEIKFRGRGSVEGNTSGIYVVDGVVRDGGIEDINPDDIQSIEFLKDASAQAIYGSRAVNGVVLISTKRGRNNRMDVSYHGYTTIKSIERNFDVYSGSEFAQLRREAQRSDDPGDLYPADVDMFTTTEIESINNGRFVDWEDELVRSGRVNSHSIGISGGTDQTKIYSSVNYFREDGVIPTSSFTRRSYKLNIDQKISERVSTAFDISLMNTFTERASNVNVITFSPLGIAYDDDNNLVQYPSGEELTGTNPLWNIRESDHDTRGNDFVITVMPKVKITKSLEYIFKASMTRKNSERGQYLSSLHSSGDSDRGIARIDNQLREAYLIENILTYNKRIDENNLINITAVQAVDENNFSQTFSEGKGFMNETLGYDGITNAINSFSVERRKTRVRTASYMARARYNLFDKYLFTATIRADGASVNAKDHKWTYNPATAFAWKIHNEPFLKDVEMVDELKLRVSYGSLANALRYPYTSLFTADGQNYIFDGESASGYSPSVILPNQDLKHETITTFNVGLDFAVLKNLFIGSIEYYRSSTKDLLLRKGVPSITGYEFTYFNAGEVLNKGLEVGITANVLDKENFQWSVSGAFSMNRNELIDLYTDGDGNPILEDDKYNYYVGQAIGVFKQYQFDGIWQLGDDFANAPQANPLSADPQANLRPGDIKIKDTNGVDVDGNLTGKPDGLITEEDKVFTDPNPDWFGSLSSIMSYKGFDLFFDFYFVQGASKVNPFLSVYNNGGTLQGKLNGIKVPYYTPENPSTTFPRPSFDAAPKYLGAFAIRDASYARLRTVRLSYTLPVDRIMKFGVQNVSVYFTASNLFTITDYLGYSPEVNIRDTYSSADTGYPDAKSFTFGLKFNL